MVQLQARYPAASLIAEFVIIHQESFVVRALVQAGGMTLATGMAAAMDIEQAEDRAKIRALSALGIGSFTAALPPQPPLYPLPSTSTFSPAPDFTSSESHPNSISEDLSSSGITPPGIIAPKPIASTEPSSQESPLTPPIPNQPVSFTTSASFAPLPQMESDRPEYELNYQPESYEFENYGSEPDQPENAPLPTVEPIPETISPPPDSTEPRPSPQFQDVSQAESPKPASSTGKGKSAKRKSENTEIAPPITGENDRSEEIAKIGLEMKRLGWTTEQGRNYLKRTYGKRSRQELDDSELIDFLRYLETQISPSESPF